VDEFRQGTHTGHVFNFGKDTDIRSPGFFQRMAQGQNICFAAHKRQHHTGNTALLCNFQVLQVFLRQGRRGHRKARCSNAFAALQGAAEDYPEHLNLFMTAEARMLIEASKPEDALGVMKTALAEQPDDVSLAYDTAMIAQNVGHFEETESILKDILSDDPDHVQAGNALAYLWVTRDMNLPEARRLLEHAYRLSPVDPYVLDSMGWLCFKEGRYDQAAEFTLASLKRLFDVEVACHLVEILAVSGRDHEAEKLFRELEQRAGSDALVLDLAKRLNYKTK